MSAFVVGDTTINRVLAWLTEISNASEREEILLAAGIAPDHNWLGNLGTAMKQMNVDAVNQRYRGHNNSEFSGYERLQVTDMQALKSLQCWHYQCSEGNVPERALYQAFQILEGKIALHIVNKSPAWEAADWG